jgi:trimeric autotransporter adhesin
VATGTNSVALGMGASATHNNAAAIGSGATTTRDNQVVVGTATNTYTTPGITSNASIAAQSGPLSIVTTDANGNLAQVLVSNLIPTVTSPCQELVAGALQCGTNSQASATQSTALGQTSTASGIGSTAVGFGSNASGAGSTALGAGANAGGTAAVAIGVGSTASAPNSVALGNGSVASVANPVSVGASGAERRITNVAPGINQTDAVNVSQLQSFATGFQSQIGGLQQQIFANNIEARRGIAAAAALSPAIMPTAPGRTTLSVNGGFFHGETGVGIGVSHRLDLSMPVMLYGSYANERRRWPHRSDWRGLRVLSGRSA